MMSCFGWEDCLLSLEAGLNHIWIQHLTKLFLFKHHPFLRLGGTLLSQAANAASARYVNAGWPLTRLKTALRHGSSSQTLGQHQHFSFNVCFFRKLKLLMVEQG